VTIPMFNDEEELKNATTEVASDVKVILVY
jgi:hypothetical protein